MTENCRLQRTFEEGIYVYLKVLYQNVLAETEDIDENLIQGSLCLNPNL